LTLQSAHSRSSAAGISPTALLKSGIFSGVTQVTF
jgi:hypothetical protein